MKKLKILFILKKRQDSNGVTPSHIGLSTGLFNSSTYVNDMLVAAGVDSQVEVVTDNNDIDRVVTKHKPTHVIIEALWVVPSKFDVLCKLHPKVMWIIRLHSNFPFLANEGIAFQWIGEYVTYPSLFIALNSPRALEQIRYYCQEKMSWTNEETKERIIYLPNYYPQDYITKSYHKHKEYINISCFGAVRPFKNHITQAMAAIEFADKIGKKLKFHINVGRIEQKGDSIIKNLEYLFDSLTHCGHELIKHEWTPGEDFVKLSGKMDIAMQVSLSETFNIVGADSISQGVPLVGSSEIPWLSWLFTANPTNSKSIQRALMLTHLLPDINVKLNQNKLTSYTNETEDIWLKYFDVHNHHESHDCKGEGHNCDHKKEKKIKKNEKYFGISKLFSIFAIII